MISIASSVKLRSGYCMPLLGFGVYQNYTTAQSVREALGAGYRHIDSAQAYRNEAHVGEGVRASGIPRSEVFVTTKCINRTHGYESTLKGVDTSLARFGFDYIDLFLIHDPMSGAERRLATYRALLKARDEGKIRSVGVSNYGVKHLEEIKAEGLELPAVNQIELHPFCQQKPIVAWCREHGVVVQAYCPILRGKMDAAEIQVIAAKYARDPAQILLRWSLQHGFVPLPKSARPERIVSNALLYDFELDREDMMVLDGLDRGREGAISWNPVEHP
ncbi:Aldo/keto reductase [Vararia minispora EC-137]|uniref:Aldo/keto reductase n=1 Tax=Vararia minispora EC-137 TaxID=1314806 RepID=A0ACB8QZR4_9AGAM|nr:Aldo/keto reductase [Vararia minispora EC-137]